jgi:hypothetical protein
MKIPKQFKTTLLIVTLLLLIINNGYAQKYKGQRFKVGVNIGVNVAQIDGDYLFGYRKLGAQAGIQGIAMINKKQFISLEFLFSQRGAISGSSELANHTIAFTDIRMNYVEIPFLFNQYINTNQKSPWRFYLQTGLSVNRLLSASIEGINSPNNGNPILVLRDRTDELSTFEIGFIVGGLIKLNDNWGVLIRHNVGVNTIFKPLETDELLNPLRNFVLTIGGTYIIP